MLIYSLTIALVIIAIKGLTEEGMPLSPVYNKILPFCVGKKHKQKWWFKMIIGCRKCMASLWGFVAAMGLGLGWETPIFILLVFAWLTIYENIVLHD
jgi:hypothetical protein